VLDVYDKSGHGPLLPPPPSRPQRAQSRDVARIRMPARIRPVLRRVSRRCACTADGKMCGVGLHHKRLPFNTRPYSRCALDGIHPLKPSAPTPRQALDLTSGVTKRATRLFTCNTTFPVTTQTLARKSPAQHPGIRCEASTTGTRGTRGSQPMQPFKPIIGLLEVILPGIRR
jgi:hypothetical protein